MSSFAIMTAGSAVASLVGKSVLSQAVYDTSTVLLGFARSSVYNEHPELSSNSRRVRYRSNIHRHRRIISRNTA